MDTRFIAPIALLVTGVTIFLVSNAIGFIGLFLLLPVLLAVLLVNRPKRLLFALWVVTLFVPALELIINNTLVKLIEQGIGAVLLAVLIGDVILTRKIETSVRTMSRLVTVLLFVAGASAIVNKVPPIAILVYILTYIKHLWIFCFAVRFLTPADNRTVFLIGVVSVLIQVVANVFAYLGMNPLPLMLRRHFFDFSIGTLGNSHYVGYIMVAFCLLMIAYSKHTKIMLKRVLCWLAALVSLVQFYFCFPIHAYPLLVGALGSQFLTVSPASPGRWFRRAWALVLLGIVALMLTNQGFSIDIQGDMVSDKAVQRGIENLRHGLKFKAYREVFLNAGEHIRFPILGGGPGNYSSTTAFILQRPLSQLPHMFVMYTTLDPREVQAGSIISLTRTGYIAIQGELGPLGLVSYWGLYLCAAYRIWSQWRRGMYSDIYSRALAEAFVPMVGFFLVLNILIDAIIIYPLNIGLWIWAGALWNPLPATDHESPPMK
jgi:hypothetical protein